MQVVAESGVKEDVDLSIGRAARWLLDRQHRDGYWVGELEGDTILESEYVLLKAFLGELDEPVVVKVCRYLREHQCPGGGWGNYPGGPFDLSTTVKGYFALKLVGVPTTEPDMVRARELILEAGGAARCNSFTRFYLALLGQIRHDECPYVPPELIRVPSWLPFSLAEMSAWTRTMVVPLSLFSLLKPCRQLPPEQGIAELYAPGKRRSPIRMTWPPFSWANFFVAADRMMKVADKVLPKSWREGTKKAAVRWMLEHCENSDGLGAIYPPMVYAIVILRALDYAPNDHTYRWCVRQLEDLMIEEGETVRLQPCVSPVWDTAIAGIALADAAERADAPAIREEALPKTARWLLGKEIRVKGDWAVRRRFRNIEPSGWAFEFLNDHYADLDDTAMVLMTLHKSGLKDDPAVKETTARALKWLLALQGRDGGWAAFDADIDNEVLTKVPFADHNAMLDPSCPDITARVLEMLGTLGHGPDHPSARKGLDFLWKTQEPEGCWYGRWGVNYVYGTWQVLQGLQALGLPMDHPRLRKAADWLESVQQPSGAWGESCASYDDRDRMGQGEATASQTAWGVLGLIAAGRGEGEAARRGISWLVAAQNEDGGWDEEPFTGTGFPKVFYLRYHYYRAYFPLMALARSR